MSRRARFLVGAVVSVLHGAAMFCGVLILVIVDMLTIGITVPTTLDVPAPVAATWPPLVVVLMIQVGVSMTVLAGTARFFVWRKGELWLILMAGPLLLWVAMLGLSIYPSMGLDVVGSSQFIWLVTDGPHEFSRLSVLLLAPPALALLVGGFASSKQVRRRS